MFPTQPGPTTHATVDEVVSTTHSRLREAFEVARATMAAEASGQKQYYDRHAGATLLKPGDLVFVHADAVVGHRKINNAWLSDDHEVVRPLAPDIPTYDSLALYTCFTTTVFF